MQEIITIQEAASILGFKSVRETRSYLKWMSIQVTNIAHNSFVKRKEFEAALERLMNKNSQQGGAENIYVPKSKKEKEFYAKLLKSLDKKE